jgi:hypothetical protein
VTGVLNQAAMLCTMVMTLAVIMPLVSQCDARAQGEGRETDSDAFEHVCSLFGRVRQKASA